jgi:hypothetical protein
MIHRPLGTVPNDLERVVALVTRESREGCAPDVCLIDPMLDESTSDAVANFWNSRIKTFVPLLALRRVRCCIRAGDCSCGLC